MATDRDRAGYVAVITNMIIDSANKELPKEKHEEMEAVVDAAAALLTDFFNNIAKIASAVEEMAVSQRD